MHLCSTRKFGTFASINPTLDNPSWKFEINLISFEDIIFKKTHEEQSDTDWISCFVETKSFIGYGRAKILVNSLIFSCLWTEKFFENKMKIYDELTEIFKHIHSENKNEQE